MDGVLQRNDDDLFQNKKFRPTKYHRTYPSDTDSGRDSGDATLTSLINFFFFSIPTVIAVQSITHTSNRKEKENKRHQQSKLVW